MNTIDRLKQYKEERGLGLAAIARALDISTSTLSQVLSETYTGNVEKILRDAELFLAREEEKSRRVQPKQRWVETKNARRFNEVATICHLDGEIGVVYGDAGLGKTMAAHRYAETRQGVILIEADLGFTAKVLFSELHRALGYDGRGGIHSMFDDCVRRLSESGRLIIIDEAEHLPYRALELLRRVHDKAHVGVLLVGMPRLVSNLRGKRGEYAQLYSRVGVAASLQALDVDDSKALVETWLPGANGLCKEFHASTKGNARMLTKLVRRSIRIAEINGIQVDRDVIRKSTELLII